MPSGLLASPGVVWSGIASHRSCGLPGLASRGVVQFGLEQPLMVWYNLVWNSLSWCGTIWSGVGTSGAISAVRPALSSRESATRGQVALSDHITGLTPPSLNQYPPCNHCFNHCCQGERGRYQPHLLLFHGFWEGKWGGG